MQQYKYQVGGSLAVDAVSYVARIADCQLYNYLIQGDFCYVLDSPQMGKSSLLVQTLHRLKQNGDRCCYIDLTTIGSEHTTPLQWYKGLVAAIASELGLADRFNLKYWWKEQDDFSYLQRLSKFIEELLTVHFPYDQLFIFVDEIDTILNLDFTVDDFFALIRYCYNQRAINPEYERISFTISGVATATDLIGNKKRTPFNIGRAIKLSGFQLHEVEPLIAGLSTKYAEPSTVMEEILAWTGGQPFLTQKICELAVRRQTGERRQNNSNVIDINRRKRYRRKSHNSDVIDNLIYRCIIQNWKFQDEPEHFRTIRNRLLVNENLAGRLLGIYQQIIAEGKVEVNNSREQIELLLSGLVIREDENLIIKNRIYQQVFDQQWVNLQLQKLRPYSQTYQAWIDSGESDESRLLRGQALKDALIWSQGKSLSDQDYQYLAASTECDRQEAQKTLEAARLKEIEIRLAEEEQRSQQEQKNHQLQRWLLAVVSAALIITFVLGITAFMQYRQARLGEVKALIWGQLVHIIPINV